MPNTLEKANLKAGMMLVWPTKQGMVTNWVETLLFYTRAQQKRAG